LDSIWKQDFSYNSILFGLFVSGDEKSLISLAPGVGGVAAVVDVDRSRRPSTETLRSSSPTTTGVNGVKRFSPSPNLRLS